MIDYLGIVEIKIVTGIVIVVIVTEIGTVIGADQIEAGMIEMNARGNLTSKNQSRRLENLYNLFFIFIIADFCRNK